ncbi:ABC transporter permease [Nonomuraea sp. NPDC050383]|uniref:ABC transporter permease n=1 Tax=Nonomuraea sp. NPDC050383 TaxID=3364362 RepID=UPI0037938F4C
MTAAADAAPPRPTRAPLVLPALFLPILFLAVLAVAVAAPGLVAGADPLAADPLRALAPPGAGHLLGTDHLGRDVLARVVHGARHSLSIGVLATAVAVTAGVLLGLAAGLAHRWAGEALARAFDVLSTFPELLLALLVVAVTGPGTVNVVLAIGIAQIPTYARVVRAQTFVVRRSGYVEQAVTFGHSRGRIVARHVLPNALGPIPVLATLGLGQAIVAASGLSFLGMGPQPPAAEWGAMLSEARNYLRVAWWEALFPGLAVTLTVVCVTVVGRRLQRRFEGRAA